MKSFTKRREEQIAAVRENGGRALTPLQAANSILLRIPERILTRDVPAPRPGARPERRQEPIELLTCSRKVLLFCLGALESIPRPTTDQRVAAEMLRREVGP